MMELHRGAGGGSKGEVDLDVALISDYLAGCLSPEHKAAFETRLVEDGALFDRVFPMIAEHAVAERDARIARAIRIEERPAHAPKARWNRTRVRVLVAAAACIAGIVAMRVGAPLTYDIVGELTTVAPPTADADVQTTSGVVTLTPRSRWVSGVVVGVRGVRDVGVLQGGATLDLTRPGLLLRTPKGEQELSAGRYRVLADSADTQIARLDDGPSSVSGTLPADLTALLQRAADANRQAPAALGTYAPQIDIVDSSFTVDRHGVEHPATDSVPRRKWFISSLYGDRLGFTRVFQFPNGTAAVGVLVSPLAADRARYYRYATEGAWTGGDARRIVSVRVQPNTTLDARDSLTLLLSGEMEIDAASGALIGLKGRVVTGAQAREEAGARRRTTREILHDPFPGWSKTFLDIRTAVHESGYRLPSYERLEIDESTRGLLRQHTRRRSVARPENAGAPTGR